MVIAAENLFTHGEGKALEINTFAKVKVEVMRAFIVKQYTWLHNSCRSPLQRIMLYRHFQ